MVATKSPRITPADIEAKLKSFQGDVQEKVEDKRTGILLGAGVAGLILVIAFYFLGRRSGSKRSAVVEIRRV